MSSLICPDDKAENPVQALLCQQCHGRLSRVQVGSLFVDRYQVQSCIGKTDTGFRYLVTVSATEESRVLHEIIPTAPGDSDDRDRFQRAAQHLIESRPRCLVPTLEYFSRQSCYYTVEAVPEGVRLQQAIETDGAFPEQRVGAFLDAMLVGLKELYSLNPPVYLGALDPERVLLSNENIPVFLESAYLTDSVIKSPDREVAQNLTEDIRHVAHIAATALAGAISLDEQLISDAISRVNDLVLTCMFDWILCPRDKGPDSFKKLEECRSLILQAESEKRTGNIANSINLLDHAYYLCKSRRLLVCMHQIEASQSVAGPSGTTEHATTLPEPTSERQALSNSQGVQHLSALPSDILIKRLLIFVASALLIVVAGWFWTSGAATRNFNLAMNQGHLFAPPEKSAYDYYKEILRVDGPDTSRVQTMNKKVQTLLEALSNVQFARWHENLDLTADEWEKLAKAEDWLVSMNPGDTTSQGRKEFADAQLLYLRGRYSAAITGFQRALLRVPHWDLALLGVGDSCLALNRYTCAESYYTQANQSGSTWNWPSRRLAALSHLAR